MTNVNKKIADKLVETNNKIEDTVMSNHKKIEDKFVDTFLKHDGETTEEAEQRLKNKNAQKKNGIK